MARPSPAKFTDEQLKEWLEIYKNEPNPSQKVAELFGVDSSAVRHRIAKLDRKSAPMHTEASKRAIQSVFDIATNLETVHQDLQGLIGECATTGEKTAVYGRVLETLKLAKGCLETLYAVQEIQGFMEEVLSVIDSVEPGTRERILSALQERRALRAAFIQRPFSESS